MLLIFRLNKDTTSTVQYVIPHELNFSQLRFKGFSWERGDNNAADQSQTPGAPLSGADLPVYLHMDCFDDNEIMFFQGRNATLITNETDADLGTGNSIPLGGIKEGRELGFRTMDLKLIDQPTIWALGKVITISLRQIQIRKITALTNNQAFGAINNDVAVDNDADPVEGPSPYDHGVNLYFELDLDKGHQFTEGVVIADAAA